jgi:fatty acid desaturase
MAGPLAHLPPAVRRALAVRHDGPGLVRLAGHRAAIAGAGGAIAAGSPGWPLLLPVPGVLIVFLFKLQHDCTRRTPFRSDRLCDARDHAIGFRLPNPFPMVPRLPHRPSPSHQPAGRPRT